MDGFAARISEPETIVFKASSLIVLGTLLVSASLFVGLALHQSSIGTWDYLFGGNNVERRIDLGSPKAIRGDEWNVQTPWVLNQVQRGQAISNPNVGGAESAFVSSTPVSGWVKWAQPKFWGFSLFSLERGFSWIWAYKLFGLLASFFVLLLFLTRGHTLLSLTGALWVWGSSFVQWWYSSHLPELLIGFALGITGALYLFRAQRSGGIWFGALLLVYSVCTLLLHVYPPFIVPLAYLAIFIFVGFFWQFKGYAVLCSRVTARSLAACAVLVVVSIFVFAWALVAQETISLMTQTVYPGLRYHLGGEMRWDRLWYGFFEAIRVRENDLPLLAHNASEGSSFLLLFPLLFLLIKPSEWWKLKNRMVLALMTYCLVILAWMALPLPLVLREVLAAMGWSMSTSQRAEVGLGVASILIIVVWMSQNPRQNETYSVPYLAWQPWVSWGLATVFLIGWGLWLHGLDPAFFNLKRLAIAICLVAIVFTAVVHRHAWGLFAALLFFVAPSLTVNPIQSGLGSIFEAPVLNQAHKLGHGSDDRWAVIGNYILSQGMKARGLDVVTGSNFVPNLELMRALDPHEQYKSSWNRYAHVTFISDTGADKPVFELVHGDAFVVRLNICTSKALKALGVNRLAYTEPISPADLQCLNDLMPGSNGSVRFFEIK